MGCTIAFSVLNKPFKPLGIPKGRVMSPEGLTGMVLINIVIIMTFKRIKASIMVLIH